MLNGYPIRIMRSKGVVGLPTLLFGLSGCAARVRPKNLAHDRFDYSAAITRLWKEQMLLNMVKLRYMDPPMFLDVQQVVQQYTREGSGVDTRSGLDRQLHDCTCGYCIGPMGGKSDDHLCSRERREVYEEPFAASITR